MIEFIQNKTKSYLFSCCDNYAAKLNAPITETQIIIGLDDNTVPRYTLCHAYHPKEDITILQVMGLRFDILGHSVFATNFIQKAIVRFWEKYGMPVSVICVPVLEGKKKNIQLFVYSGIWDIRSDDWRQNKYLETIEFESLFSAEDFVVPQMEEE